jgi:mono/diheme cytochrome c family protein
MRVIRKVARVGVLLIVVAFFLIQLVPYGRAHTNPPVLREPAWDSQQTRALAQKACFDCHSNETAWPWYTDVAPVSWLVMHDVEEGRRSLNFSEWGSGNERGEEGEELAETVLEGEMPPATYLPLHSEARLTAQEKRQLSAGLVATASGR